MLPHDSPINANRYSDFANRTRGAVRDIVTGSSSAHTAGYTTINRLLNEEGYTVRGVQKLLRDREPKAAEAPTVARESAASHPSQIVEEARPPAIEIFRLIALRDRLAAALER